MYILFGGTMTRNCRPTYPTRNTTALLVAGEVRTVYVLGARQQCTVAEDARVLTFYSVELGRGWTLRTLKKQEAGITHQPLLLHLAEVSCCQPPDR